MGVGRIVAVRPLWNRLHSSAQQECWANTEVGKLQADCNRYLLLYVCASASDQVHFTQLELSKNNRYVSACSAA